MADTTSSNYSTFVDPVMAVDVLLYLITHPIARAAYEQPRILPLNDT